MAKKNTITNVCEIKPINSEDYLTFFANIRKQDK